MIDIKLTNWNECNKLSKDELKALILLLLSIESNDGLINENCLFRIKENLYIIIGLKKGYCLWKDIEIGLMGLIKRKVIKLENGYYEIVNSNIIINKKKVYGDFWTLNTNRSLHKMYLKMLVDLSGTDLKLLIKIISELKEFDYCENIIRISSDKREELSKELDVSVNTIKKSIMKLKNVGALNQIKYNKYQVERWIKYKEYKLVIKIDIKRIQEICNEKPTSKPKVNEVKLMEIEDEIEEL